MDTYRIFMVEDDPVIAQTVQQHLISWGYPTRCARDFSRVLEEFREESPQLVLMDISLPFFNGYHWCREIRRISRVPVMFLSSSSDNLDIVTAMNMGADDFISKPFDLSVLTAKVQALLRRTYEMGVPQDTRLRCGSGWLDMEDGTLQNGDCTITLTRGELKILRILLENRGRVVSREDLAVQLWQTDSFVDENTLSVAVTRLRRRMKEAGLCEVIHTKKGMGYWVD